MKKMFYSLLVTCFLTAPTGSRSQVPDDSIAARVNKLGAAFIQEKEAIGLSIGIFHNGKTGFYNFGSTQKDKPLPPNQHTVYEIGSITKTFVSYLLANAVLQHKVNLDDDIRKYLKEPFPNLEYEGHPIQLVHLANTTSLLPDWLPELPVEMKSMAPDSALTYKIKLYKDLTQKDFLKALHTVKLDTIPGTRRYHSNAGAQLLAYILEEVYQQPIDKLVARFITGLNKMKNTAFVRSDKMKNLATGYTATGKTAIYEFVIPYFLHAGGLGSTTNDLVNYIRLLLDKNNPIATLCLKKTADISAASGKTVPMRPDNTAAPEIYSTALNWFKYQPDSTSLQIWADGGTNGFNSYLVIYPKKNSGIVLLANKSDEKIFRALPGIALQISKALE
jgi:serine-type D-Ala-D-Ala carboxypeptidase/endopeptidase